MIHQRKCKNGIHCGEFSVRVKGFSIFFTNNINVSESADEQLQRTDYVNDDCNGQENGQQCCGCYFCI